jgi:hypothetical protein
LSWEGQVSGQDLRLGGGGSLEEADMSKCGLELLEDTLSLPGQPMSRKATARLDLVLVWDGHRRTLLDLEPSMVYR